MKTNPRRIPRTQADVDRARNEGRHEGYQALMGLFLWVRMERFGDTDEDLQKTKEGIDFYAGELEAGRLKLLEILDALSEEHGVTIELS